LKKKSSASLLAVALGLAVFASACGDDGGTEATTTTAKPAASTGATATTVAPATTVKKVEVSGTLAASGATFPKGFYELAIAEFKKAQPKATLTYAGGGSGKGRTDLQSQVVDFAGSDGLVKDADKPNYKGGEFLYFPTVVAPITVSYNLDGVDKLQLSAETVAKIFQREIKTWDDPAIVAENPDAKAKLTGNITVARRSDGSGTTENFTIYLNKSVGAGGTGIWKLKSGSTVEWPADTQAGNGNAGVAQIVKDTKGAIGYVDYSDAKATGLKFASLKNKAGKYVAASLDGASAAAEGATINPDLSYDPLWADGDKAYPIAAPTWILVYTKQTDKAKGETVKEFLRFILTDGQKLAPSIDYAPLPKGLDEKALAQLDKIQIPA
jgi:phosphate transport system substrate-binding protein